MNEVKLNIELTPAEADEVIAGLHNHSADLESLAQKILISAQSQYSQIVTKQMEEQQKNIKAEEQKNEKGENK